MVRSTLPRRPGLLVPLLIALALGAWARALPVEEHAPAEDAEGRVILHGSVSPLARNAADLGAAPVSLPAQRQLLLLRRPAEREMELTQYLEALEDSHSPQFHQYLSPGEFRRRFGPDPADAAEASAWLEQQGFTVRGAAAGGMAVEFSGTVDQIQSAFRTRIHRLSAGGRVHLANVQDPSLPSSLARAVVGVSPINDFFPRPQQLPGRRGAWDASRHRFVPALTVGISGAPYLFVGPGDAATLYDAPTTLNTRLAGRPVYDGSGVTIGILTDGGVSPANIGRYRSLFGLPSAALSVVADGNAPVGADDSESTLDAEVAGAIAPGARLVLYQAADTTFQSGVMLALLRALDDNTADILNLSYSLCELAAGPVGNQLILDAMEQAAAQGIAVTVAAGDSGSAGCDDPSSETEGVRGFAVNALASTPYAVAVGGTDFAALDSSFDRYVGRANGANYTSVLGPIPETVWNNSTAQNGAAAENRPWMDLSGDTNIAAGGGGASSAALYDAAGHVLGGYPKPAWQQGFESGAGMRSDGVRDLPDVSLLAGSGMHAALWATCRDSDCQGAAPTITGVGGTSASAPAFAGLLALVLQRTGTAARLGQPNWVLYALAASHAADFHPVPAGNNAVACAPASADCGPNGFLAGYDAGAPYSLATGLGSVDMAALVSDWTTVGRAATSVTLTLGAATLRHGQPVEVAVEVSPAEAGGAVALVAASGAAASRLVLPLAEGSASSRWAGLPGGSYSVYASYGGDGSHAGGLSPPVALTVAPEDSVVRLSITGPGGVASLADASVPYGSYMSLDARPVGVSAASASAMNADATGVITFSDSAGAAVGSGMLDATGDAEFPAHTFPVGTHSVTAAYGGDPSYNPAVSAPLTFTVRRAATLASLAASASSTDGGAVILSASIQVSEPGFLAAPPAGMVTFTDQTTGVALGTAPASTAARDASTGAWFGVATLTVAATALAPGENRIAASYAGDASFLPSPASLPATVVCAAGCGNGRGESLAVTVSPPSSSAASSASGSASTAAVLVLPGGGFTGAVRLACTVAGSQPGDVHLPSCVMNTDTVTITGAAGARASVQVVASGAQVLSQAAEPGPRGWTRPGAGGGSLLACLLCLWLPRRKARAAARILLVAAALGAAICGSSGCGGGSTTAGTGGSTTPDTYTVTIHASDVATGTLSAQASFPVAVR